MDSTTTLRVAMAQLNLVVGDVEGNARQIIDAALKAHQDDQTELIVYPELALTGYPPEDLLFRKNFIDRVNRALSEICEQLPLGLIAVVGYPERDGDRLFNSACVLQRGRCNAVYRKHKLPNYGVFDEVRYFAAGNQACIFDVKGIKVGVTICEDLWFPEPIQLAKQMGADLIVNLNASPFHITKSFEREQTIQQRAQEVQLPIVYTNMVGGQDELVFDGRSFAVSAEGEIMQRGESFETGIYTVDLLGDAYSVSPKPGTVTDNLGFEEAVYNALVLGVRDYVRKNGFKGSIIGLSGGIDSALTLAIAVDALGAEQVEAVMMPSRYTADMSLEDAQGEAKALGVEYHVLSIEQPFEAFLDVMLPELGSGEMGVTQENIQARCRGIMLMAISNRKGKIVLTTGNKSEMSVGYATLYGDMAGGFAPIKDIPKTLVYQLSRYRNTLSDVIPERVLIRPPSAELAPDQKDEDSLPPYDDLDPILRMYIEEDRAPEEIIDQGYDSETVYRVVAMVNRNEYKRRQAPPGVRITRRAFGRDRRYPITSGYRYN